jgi:phosphatidylglycerophosphatase A
MMVFRPRPGFVFAHPAHFLAFGFGVGLARFAPGTFGTLLAFPLWWLLGNAYPLPVFWGLIAIFFAVGVWACAITGRHLGIADHGGMVWDEVVAMLAVLGLIPAQPGWQIAAFFVFRAFDVVKPPPIRSFEKRFKGGFGVMFDDILAAGYTLLVLAIAQRLLF